MLKKLFKKFCTFIVNNAGITFKVNVNENELKKAIDDYSKSFYAETNKQG